MECKIKEEPKDDSYPTSSKQTNETNSSMDDWVLRRVGHLQTCYHLNGMLTGQKQKLTVGRKENAVDILCPGKTVSKIHCELEFIEDCWFVRDLNSSNKTFVNMKSISAQTALQVGDLLGIGNLDNYDENHFMFYVLKTDVKQEIAALLGGNQIAPLLYCSKIKQEKNEDAVKKEQIKSLFTIKSDSVTNGDNKSEEMITKTAIKKEPFESDSMISPSVAPKHQIKSESDSKNCIPEATIKVLDSKSRQIKSNGGRNINKSGIKKKCRLSNNQIREKYAKKMNDPKLHPNTESQVILSKVMLGIVRQRIDNSSFKGETLEETEKRFPLLKADSDFGTKATQDKSREVRKAVPSFNQNSMKSKTVRGLERQPSSVNSAIPRSSIDKTKRRQSKLDELVTSKSSIKEDTPNKAVKRPSTFNALFKIPKKLKQDTSSIENERTSNHDSKKNLRKGGKLEESHSSNRQQFMEDPSFLSDLDKRIFSKEKKEKTAIVRPVVRPVVQPTVQPAAEPAVKQDGCLKGILTRRAFQSRLFDSRKVTFKCELNSYFEIPSRYDPEFTADTTTDFLVKSQNAEVPSAIEKTKIETISLTTLPRPSNSPKFTSYQTPSSQNHHYSRFVEAKMSSPMLLHQNSELCCVVQKVTPMTIVQDLSGIIEENPQRVLLTTIYQIIGELKMRILFWNFNWIAEQNCSENMGTMPPILEAVKLETEELSKLDVQSLVTDHASIEGYFRSFRSLVLQETWSIIRQNVQSDTRHAIRWQVFVANQNPAEEGFFLIDCQAVFQAHLKTTELDVGTLVVLMPLSQLVPKIFGIVEQLQWKPMFCVDVNKDEQLLAYFQLRVKNPLNPLFLNSVQPVSKITTLCPILNQFSMITELDHSPLKHIIIQPSKHEEAFQLESSFSEQCGNVALCSNDQYSAVQSISRTILMSDPKSPKIALLQGPPGTGKTHLVMEIVVELVFQHHRQFGTNPRILVCAPSDSAVDEIVSRLLLKYPQSQDDYVKIIRIDGKLSLSRAGSVKDDDIAHVRLVNKANAIWMSKMFELKSDYLEDILIYREELEKFTKAMQRELVSFSSASEAGDAIKIRLSKETLANLESHISGIRSKLEQLKNDHIEYCVRQEKQQIVDIHSLKEKIICDADIICTTFKSCRTREMNKIFFSKQSIIEGCNRPFLCGIYDEASKCSELESLSPLGLGINKLIMIGDASQPPQSQVMVHPEQIFSRHHSMFNRFCSYFMNLADPSKNSVISLHTQHRMDPTICQWPSEFFYSSKLLTSLKLHRFGPCITYSVLDVTDGKENCTVDDAGGLSICNQREAELVATIVKVLITFPALKKKSIGIITFYHQQRKIIEEKIVSKCGREVENICVNTAEFFHGKENDIVIVSCVRAKNGGDIGLVSSPLLISDSLTRAKESLIVCGNSKTLKVSEAWKSLYENAMIRGCMHLITSTCNESVLRAILLRQD